MTDLHDLHDLLIVGAGAAGLAAAYFLRDTDLDLLVLDAADEVGGRIRSVPVGGLPVGTGALFVYRDTLTHELADELGVRTVPFLPTTYGISMDGVTAVATDDDELVAALPLDREARVELRGFLAAAVAEYRDHTRGGQLADSSSALGTQTVAERIAGLRPENQAIVLAAVRGGAVGPPEALSAQYALRYFASYVAREQSNRLYAVQGMQAIPEAMASRLAPGTVRLSTSVTDVRFDVDRNAYRVTAREPGADGDSTMVARRVLVTVPAPAVPGLCPDLPPWKRDALRQADTPGSTTLSVAADISGLPDLRDWSFVTTVGRRFDAIINPLPGGRPDPGERDIAHFVCYGNSAGHLPDLAGDGAAVAAWVEDFLGVAPQLRGRILGTHVETWEHCFAVLSPQRSALLPVLQAPVGGLHFAGDWSSATAGSHGAFAEGRRVAEQLRAGAAR